MLSACTLSDDSITTGDVGPDGQILPPREADVFVAWETTPVGSDAVNVDAFLTLKGAIDQRVFVGRYSAPLLQEPLIREWWAYRGGILRIERASDTLVDVLRADDEETGVERFVTRVEIPADSVVQCMDIKTCL